ncbi:hypothetical protein J6E39_03715 [bacterium]|nr:hypothetical protein [bacterium]
MKKKAKVIQISGLRGFFIAGFIVVCLIAGFVAFPSIMLMHGWNYLSNILAIPSINAFQGGLLWALIAGSIYVLNDRRKFITTFRAPTELSDEELKRILKQAQMQSQTKILNAMIKNAAEMKKSENDSSNNVENKTPECVSDSNMKEKRN